MKYICEQCRSNVTDSQIFCDNCGSQLSVIDDSDIYDQDDSIVAYGFAIYTSNDDLIEQNAEEDGLLVNDEFWDKVNNAVMLIEQNILEYMRRELDDVYMVRDEGHDSSDALVGTITVEEYTEIYNVIEEAVIIDEPLSTGKGDLDQFIPEDVIYEGIEDDIAAVIEVGIEFFED